MARLREPLGQEGSRLPSCLHSGAPGGFGGPGDGVDTGVVTPGPQDRGTVEPGNAAWGGCGPPLPHAGPRPSLQANCGCWHRTPRHRRTVSSCQLADAGASVTFPLRGRPGCSWHLALAPGRVEQCSVITRRLHQPPSQGLGVPPRIRVHAGVLSRSEGG